MLSEGMLASLAATMAERRRALPAGSPPPRRAATVSSLMILLKSLPLVAPIASFLRLIFDRRLWPDMGPPLGCQPDGRALSGRGLRPGRGGRGPPRRTRRRA